MRRVVDKSLEDSVVGVNHGTSHLASEDSEGDAVAAAGEVALVVKTDDARLL